MKQRRCINSGKGLLFTLLTQNFHILKSRFNIINYRVLTLVKAERSFSIITNYLRNSLTQKSTNLILFSIGSYIADKNDIDCFINNFTTQKLEKNIFNFYIFNNCEIKNILFYIHSIYNRYICIFALVSEVQQSFKRG